MSKNAGYYHSKDGHNIMSAKNFNDGVVSYLQTESAFVSKIAHTRNFD